MSQLVSYTQKDLTASQTLIIADMKTLKIKINSPMQVNEWLCQDTHTHHDMVFFFRFIVM